MAGQAGERKTGQKWQKHWRNNKQQHNNDKAGAPHPVGGGQSHLVEFKNPASV